MVRRFSLLAVVLAFVAAVAAPAALAQTTYSGRATALNASVLGIAVSAGDTGPLPSSGGSQSASLASINVLGLLTAGVLEGTTSGSGTESTSEASVANLAVGLLGLKVGLVQSQTAAQCSGTTPSVSGSSQLANVSLNGQSLGTITTPNLSLALIGGIKAVLNEQTSSTSGSQGDVTVNAVHVTGPGVDVVVASSHSDITCG